MKLILFNSVTLLLKIFCFWHLSWYTRELFTRVLLIDILWVIQTFVFSLTRSDILIVTDKSRQVGPITRGYFGLITTTIGFLRKKKKDIYCLRTHRSPTVIAKEDLSVGPSF